MPIEVHPPASRRQVLRMGAAALGAVGLPAKACRADISAPSAGNVIYVFLSGGLSQHESFDPKPAAPDTVRGEFQPIATRTPGVTICEHLPMLAARSDRWSLVRSLTHASNDHSAGHHIMLTGRALIPPAFDVNSPRPTDWPAIASVAGAVLPAPQSLPPAVVLPERLIHRTGRVIPGQFAGEMGARRDPWFIEASPYNAATYGAYPEYLFHHRTGPADSAGLVFRAPNLALPAGLDASRLGSRLSLLANMERQREQQALPVFERAQSQAVSLLTHGQVQQAFDVTRADHATQDRYGRNSFGWSCLMAARLVESGARFVQVNLGNNETWDTHEGIFPNLKNYLLPPMDRAVSALLDDLHDRGLLDSTLVVVAGEFGRTPRVSTIPGASQAGRDHWGRVQSVLMAGGGVRGGQIIGASDRMGGAPSDAPHTPEELAATMYKTLGINSSAVWHDAVGRPHPVYHGSSIADLF